MKRSCLFLQFTGILFLLLFLTTQAQEQPLTLAEQVLTEGSYTNGWRELNVYFRLVLRGVEYASSEEYKVKVYYQLSSL